MLARVGLEAFAEQVISYDNETLSEVINVNTDKIIYLYIIMFLCLQM